ncbi:MAG TPA: hypothetical protein VFP72_05925, partial [Kineosporiaceae bacterium]|nr:hypothetical protein [Kineosporiaceae bacterium]
GALTGDAQKALSRAVGVVTWDGDLTLEKLAAGFEELGGFLHGVGLQTQYMKIIVIEELIILAAQIAYLLAMIPWTFGASAAGIAALQVFGKEFVTRLGLQLVTAVATGEVLQVGLDAVAQLAQFAEGRRKEWDTSLTVSAAITGVIGGALSPVLAGLGHYPGKALGHALGGVLGAGAGHEAGHWAAEVVRGAAHEWLTDGMSGAAQHQGWKPDTFSLTAGAVDEGIGGLAGIGGRKGGHRYYRSMFGNRGSLPGTDITIPDKITIDRADPGTDTTDTTRRTITRRTTAGTTAGTTPVGPSAGDRSPAGDGSPVGDGPTVGDRLLLGDPVPTGNSVLVGGTGPGGRQVRIGDLIRGESPAPVANRPSTGSGTGDRTAVAWRGSQERPDGSGSDLGQPSRQEAHAFRDTVSAEDHPAPAGASDAVLPRFLDAGPSGGGRVEFVPAMDPSIAETVAQDAVRSLPQGLVRDAVQQRLTELLTAGRPAASAQLAQAIAPARGPALGDWAVLVDSGLTFHAGTSVVRLSGGLTDLVPVPDGTASGPGTVPVAPSAVPGLAPVSPVRTPFAPHLSSAVRPSGAGHLLAAPSATGRAALASVATGGDMHYDAAVRLSLSVDGVEQVFDVVLPHQVRVSLPVQLLPNGRRAVGPVPNVAGPEGVYDVDDAVTAVSTGPSAEGPERELVKAGTEGGLRAAFLPNAPPGVVSEKPLRYTATPWLSNSWVSDPFGDTGLGGYLELGSHLRSLAPLTLIVAPVRVEFTETPGSRSAAPEQAGSGPLRQGAARGRAEVDVAAEPVAPGTELSASAVTTTVERGVPQSSAAQLEVSVQGRPAPGGSPLHGDIDGAPRESPHREDETPSDAESFEDAVAGFDPAEPATEFHDASQELPVDTPADRLSDPTPRATDEILIGRRAGPAERHGAPAAEEVPGREPVPVQPVPAEPVPAEPIPVQPVPAEPVPAEPVPEEDAAGLPVVAQDVGIAGRTGARLLLPVVRIGDWFTRAAEHTAGRFTRTFAGAPAARSGRHAGLGHGVTRLVWRPPPSWTDRLAERALRGREYDLAESVAGVIAAIRGVHEIRLLEAHQLQGTQPLSEFLVGRLSGPVAADVIRRVLEVQARQDVVARVDVLGRRRAEDRGAAEVAAVRPVSARVETGIRRSLQSVIIWAAHLGANPAARGSLTERDLAEPGEFVHTLREAFGTALRQARQEVAAARVPTAERDRARLAEDLRFVTHRQFDADWAELGERVTQLLRGTPGVAYSQEAVAAYAHRVLRGRARVRAEAPDPRATDRLAQAPATVDRFGSAWGQTGLSEAARAQLRTAYREDSAPARELVRILQETPSGELSAEARDSLVRRLSQRGAGFLRSGVARELWAVPSASTSEQAQGATSQPVSVEEQPAFASVRFLDAGVELALHDLAQVVEWQRTHSDHPEAGGAIDIVAVVERLREVYQDALEDLLLRSSAPGAVASAHRSLTALTIPGAREIWSEIAAVLADLQDGRGHDSWYVMGFTTELLTMERSLAEWWNRPNSSGQVPGAPAFQRPAAGRVRFADEATAPSGGPAEGVVGGSRRRQLVELIERVWGRLDPELRLTASRRRLLAQPATTGSTVTALVSLIDGARPAEELRQELLSALVRRAGQIVLGTRLAAVAVDVPTADAAAVRLLDVGVEVALHDLLIEAPGAPGGNPAVDAGSGLAVPADLVQLLREVYRERLQELLAGAVDADAADAARRSLERLDAPAAQAVWADVARQLAGVGDPAPETPSPTAVPSEASPVVAPVPAASSAGHATSSAGHVTSSAGHAPPSAVALLVSAVDEAMARIPEAVRWQVDLRAQRLLQGLPTGSPRLRLTTRVVQTLAVAQVLADMRSGDLEAFLGVPLDLRERGALEVTAQATSAAVYELMVTQGRDRPPSVGQQATTAGVPAQVQAALAEAY